MQVFVMFFKVLKKKFPIALIYVTVFLCIAVAMSKLGGTNVDFKDTSVTLGVIDNDNTKASREFVKYISENNNVVEIENNKTAISDSIYNQIVSCVIVVNEGYQNKVLMCNSDGLFENCKSPSSTNAVFIDSKIDLYVKTLISYMKTGNNLDESLDKTNASLKKEVEVSMENFENNEKSEFSDSFAFYFQYLPYGILSVLITSLSPVLLVLFKKDIRDRTNCSCVKFSSQTAQITFASLVFTVFLWIVFVIIGILLNDGSFSLKLLPIVLNTFVFTLIALALALIVSSISKNQESVGMFTNIIGLGMCFLCGVFVPQSLLGEGVLKVARILPAYWYVKANDMITGVGDEIYTLKRFSQYITIQLIFAVALFAVSVVIFKRKKRAY